MAKIKDIEADNFGLLCICAIRYCQGRETYMPDMVRKRVRPYLPKLSDRDIGVMLADCEFQEDMNLYGDERIDKPGWLEWRDAIKAEADRRRGQNV